MTKVLAAGALGLLLTACGATERVVTAAVTPAPVVVAPAPYGYGYGPGYHGRWHRRHW